MKTIEVEYINSYEERRTGCMFWSIIFSLLFLSSLALLLFGCSVYHPKCPAYVQYEINTK